MKELIYLLLGKQRLLSNRFFALKWVEKVKYAFGLDFRGEMSVTEAKMAKPVRHFKKIAKNIRKSGREANGLRADSTKVVLEKNFALNCLEKIGGYHVWTGLDDEGNTVIAEPEKYTHFRFYGWISEALFLGLLADFLLLVFFFMFSDGELSDFEARLAASWGWFIVIFVATIVGMFIWARRWKRKRIEWVDALRTDRVAIRKAASLETGVMEVQMTFKHTTNVAELNRWYRLMSGHITRLAEELDGEAAMLWHYYDEKELSPGHNLRNELGTVDFDVDEATIDISNEPERAVFIPCVVTKHSIIFHFPKMSTADFYERYFREDRQDLNARLDELLEKQGEGLFCAKEDEEEDDA